MSKMLGFLLGISYFLVYPFILLLLLLYNPVLKTDQVTFLADNKDIIVNVEIADNVFKHQIGLMNRTSLDYNSGMLFVFQNERPRSFWMKNTLIPLDMIFVDSNLRIVNIIKNAQPCKTIACELYPSGIPAKYVVEVNAGFVDKEGIEIGDKIRIKQV